MSNRKRLKKRKREPSQWEQLEWWAVRRTENIQRMIKEMQKDESRLYEVASKILSDLSDTPWKMGDEQGSILLGWMSAQFYSKYRDAKRKKNRTQMVDLDKWANRRENPR